MSIEDVENIIKQKQEEWSSRADLTSYEKALVKAVCLDIKAEIAHKEATEFFNGVDK